MDTINGIDFENWAAACAHQASGMSEDEICKILGIEMPVWQETTEKWAAKLGDLMAEDMEVATTYGNIFANPKVGKFAGEASADVEDVTSIVPDVLTYKKIFWQQSIGAENGVDAVSILKENGLNLQQWGTINMKYIKHNNEYMDSSLSETNPEEYNHRYHEMNAVDKKWQDHWNEFYKDNAVNLSDDIDF